MQKVLLPAGTPKINYGIREIVSKGFEMENKGFPVFWENIGDPIQKGATLPEWIREIIAKKALDNNTYGYCDSKGMLQTRRFLAERTNALGGLQIDETDITFFNGLGDAIARVYSQLDSKSRVVLPSPTYPAHSSAERSRIKQEPLSYTLNPDKNWMPDFDELRALAANHPEIVAILLINPDNPSGTVYKRETLEEIVHIAKENGWFIICDEIYENLVYNGKMTRLSEVIGNSVPAIAMKGISKEIPWPGSRCGWLEYYNRSSNPYFDAFCERLDQCKMSEVCSTTLPQSVIPEIMSDNRYNALLKSRSEAIGLRMLRLKALVNKMPGVYCNGGGGAFYAIIHFDPESMRVPLPVELFSPECYELYNSWIRGNESPDMKFVLYMLAGFGICSVPLSGFNCEHAGFRITLLEETTEKFTAMLTKLTQSLNYLKQSTVSVAGL